MWCPPLVPHCQGCAGSRPVSSALCLFRLATDTVSLGGTVATLEGHYSQYRRSLRADGCLASARVSHLGVILPFSADQADPLYWISWPTVVVSSTVFTSFLLCIQSLFVRQNYSVKTVWCYICSFLLRACDRLHISSVIHISRITERVTRTLSSLCVSLT